MKNSDLLNDNFEENEKNINSNHSNYKKDSNDSWIKFLLRPDNLKIIFLFLGFLGFLFLWKNVSNQFFLLIISIAPLFIGYGFSYFLEPINNFFQKFFSSKISKIIVFIIFLSLTLSLTIGLFFIFFIQLDILYKNLIWKKGSTEFQAFLKLIKNHEDVPITIETFELNDNSFNLEYIASGQLASFNFEKKETSGIFILLIKIANSLPFLSGICFILMDWIATNLSDYNYIQSLMKNWKIMAFVLYFFFFTIIIAAFSMGKGRLFYRRLWHFAVRNQDPETSKHLKEELKRNLSAWGKGLFIVELYIFLFTALFIFVAGVINNSSYFESVIVLALFMMICNLVPYFGPVIGFIPILAIGLIDTVNNGVDQFQSWIPLIIACSGSILTQFGESAVVSPLVYSYKVNLNPITIIISLVIFGVLFGFFWTPLTIPIILIGKIIYQTFYRERELLHERRKQSLLKRTRTQSNLN